MLSRQWFGFAGANISSIYSLKQGAPVWMIWTLIILIIGPGEEILWRGYIQSQLSRRFPKTGWIVAALLYAGVHTASQNIMLILAALVCGLFWGWLYFRFNSIWMNIISHVVWDVMVFLIWPFQ